MVLSLGLLLTTAALASATTVSKLVAAPLAESEVDKYLSCVKATNEDYKIGVDDYGYILATPSTARATDFKGQDAALLDCLFASTDVLKVAIETAADNEPVEAEYVTLEEATFEYLHSKGAEGLQTVQAPAPVAQMSPLAARTNYDYNIYYDIKQGCGGLDFSAANVNACYDLAKTYASAILQNRSKTQIYLGLFSGEKCTKSELTIAANPGLISPCVDRKFISIYAEFHK